MFSQINKTAILNVVSSFRGGLWWRANCLICNSERRRKVWHQQQQQQHEKHYARTDDVMCNIARQESITRRRCCLIGRLPMSEDDDEQRPSTFSLKKKPNKLTSLFLNEKEKRAKRV